MDRKTKKKIGRNLLGLLFLLLLVWLLTRTTDIGPRTPKPGGPQGSGPIKTYPGVDKLTYAWRVYDLYDQDEFVLTPKTEFPSKVQKSHRVSWTKDKAPRFYLQLAREANFAGAEIVEVQGNSYEFKEVFLGENFWRVSEDQKNWTEPNRFSVASEFLKDPPPEVVIENREVWLDSEIVYAPVELKTVSPATGFVMEASRTSGFEPENTKTFWSADAKFRVSFFAPGEYFYRFRAVNSSQEMTEWSIPQKFVVKIPSERRKEDESEKESSGKLAVHKIHPQTKSKLPKAGSREIQLPPPLKDEQKPAASSVAKGPERAISPYLNEKYSSTKVDLEGSVWALQSKEQTFQGAEMPIATVVGIRGHKWWDRHGIEGVYKMKALSANQTGGDISPQSTELRYHYRFFTPSPYRLARELQISAFAGYEMYRSAKSNLFSSKYDLIKFGTSLEFPLWKKVDTGGEFVYGTGDGQKYEISGHIHYYLKRDWSFGVGYRIHLFEAATKNSTPEGVELPYREGYTEGYSVLRYHFE
jgi:hypothetical protein